MTHLRDTPRAPATPENVTPKALTADCDPKMPAAPGERRYMSRARRAGATGASGDMCGIRRRRTSASPQRAAWSVETGSYRRPCKSVRPRVSTTHPWAPDVPIQVARQKSLSASDRPDFSGHLKSQIRLAQFRESARPSCSIHGKQPVPKSVVRIGVCRDRRMNKAA